MDVFGRNKGLMASIGSRVGIFAVSCGGERWFQRSL